MTDVGDAVTLTFSTTTGATVTAEVTTPAGVTGTPVPVPETGTTGDYPHTFVPTTAGMWGVTFRATGTVTAVQQRWVRARAVGTTPPLATPEDVAARWRPLTAAEEDVAAAFIEDASAIVRARVPTVDARLADGSLSGDLVAMVVAGMVRRLMQSPPPGMSSWTVDDYTERFYEVQASLVLPDADLDLLAPAGATSGAFTIRPSYTAPVRWSPWC
jgi:hypothetical protein